jgi:DNA-binding NarL/FixJ family response regulator
VEPASPSAYLSKRKVDDVERYGIVLADDHVLLRQGLRRILGGVGYLEVVGEAGDGRELLTLLGGVAPDMVILDISMPHLRGIDAISRIKTIRPTAKVLILSMHKEYLYPALSAGADGYLLKEDADRELFSAIEQIRDGKIFLSPRLTPEVLLDKALARETLSMRETEVVKLVAGGKSNREISEALSISIRTVEAHRANITSKLKLKNAAEITRYAIRTGIT